MLSWLLIIAFYIGYRQGKQNLPFCLNPSWTVMFWNSAGKGEMMHSGNCQKLTSSEQKCDELVGSLISNLSKLFKFERGILWQTAMSFRNWKSVSKHFLTLISIPITVLGILQHILNVVNHECIMSLSNALFFKNWHDDNFLRKPAIKVPL